MRCQHCRYEIRESRTECPLCGAELPAAAGAGVTGEVVPWEDPEVPFPLDLFRTLREAMLEPGRFFASLRFEEPLARPVLFYLILMVASAFFTLLWEASGLYGFLRGSAGLAAAGGGTNPLLVFLFSPFLGLLGLGFEVLVYHLLVVIFVRDRRGLAATARVLCYGASPLVLNIVPFLGSLAGGVWSLVLVVIGLREAHRTTTGRAVVIVLIPVALLFLFVVTAGIVALAVLKGGGWM